MQQQKIKKENPFGVLYHIRSKADTLVNVAYKVIKK